ncbi:hypothetical protein HK104_007206 [Borealophlyctis nickersoniae]|nr:hypothetical protein HK104_007206 [Borealophlyctis nickersoniae]
MPANEMQGVATKKEEKLALLNQEIVAFAEANTLHPNEQMFREWIVSRLREMIKKGVSENAKVLCFGSCHTGLLLPWSDIDVVVQCPVEIGGSDTNGAGTSYESESDRVRERDGRLLRRLRSIIEDSTLAERKSVELILQAFVPVLKFIERTTRIRVDITVNTQNGISSSSTIRQWIEIYPPLRPLSLVLKQYLFQRGWNEAYSGGISGYLLVNLLVFFFQQQADLLPTNFAALFEAFLRFYGNGFDYKRFGISARLAKRFIRAEDRRRWRQRPPDGDCLMVEDPCDISRDLGRSCYRVGEIFKSWNDVYIRLHLLSRDGVPRRSVLSEFVQVSPEWTERRQFNIKLADCIANCVSFASIVSHAGTAEKDSGKESEEEGERARR